MSARAITKAVETRIRSAAVLNDPTGRVSGLQDSGRPPPGMGQLYYAVWWAGGTARLDGSIAEAVDVDHAVTVTITAREGVAPLDRRGAVISAADDLIDRAELLAAPGVIHGNYVNVMDVANAMIPNFDVSTNGFVEPLLLLGYGPCEEQSSKWVGSKDGPDVLTIVVRFGKCRRLQEA